jgi:hypothetical protein
VCVDSLGIFIVVCSLCVDDLSKFVGGYLESLI